MAPKSMDGPEIDQKWSVMGIEIHAVAPLTAFGAIAGLSDSNNFARLNGLQHD